MWEALSVVAESVRKKVAGNIRSEERESSRLGVYDNLWQPGPVKVPCDSTPPLSNGLSLSFDSRYVGLTYAVLSLTSLFYATSDNGHSLWLLFLGEYFSLSLDLLVSHPPNHHLKISVTGWYAAPLLSAPLENITPVTASHAVSLFSLFHLSSPPQNYTAFTLLTQSHTLPSPSLDFPLIVVPGRRNGVDFLKRVFPHPRPSPPRPCRLLNVKTGIEIPTFHLQPIRLFKPGLQVRPP